MALQATHIKFALDAINKYNVKNIPEYIQGTVYPDSRYVSGIGRELTHNDDFLAKDFANSDFNTGWQAHLYCDHIQQDTFLKDIHALKQASIIGGENEWITLTAAKIIADMEIVQSFDVQPFLQYINSKMCPNGEDILAIHKNNLIIINLYQGKTVPSLDDYISVWSQCKVSKDLTKKVYTKTTKFLNTGLNKEIASCYKEMVKAFINRDLKR